MRVDLQTIKETFDLRDFAALTIGEPKQKTNRCHLYNSPFRDDDRPSFAVYQNGYYDFGSREAGDIFTFVQNLKGCSFMDAVRELTGDRLDVDSMRQNAREMQRKTGRSDKPKTYKRHVPTYDLEADRYSRNIGLVKEYLEPRGISIATASKFGIGAEEHIHYKKLDGGKTAKTKCNRVFIPYQHGRFIRGIAFRRDDISCGDFLYADQYEPLYRAVRQHVAKEKGVDYNDVSPGDLFDAAFGPRYQKYGKEGIFGINQIVRFTDPANPSQGLHLKVKLKKLPFIIIDEGPLNALAMISAGFPTIATKVIHPRYRDLLGGIAQVFVVQHNDDAGEKYVQAWFDLFNRDNTRMRVIRVPDKFSDLGEMAASSHDILVRYLGKHPYYIPKGWYQQSYELQMRCE